MKIVLLVSVMGVALAACSQTAAGPSNAELEAFQRLDSKVGYADARIERDVSGCAIYEATDPDGRRYREPLRFENGMTICFRQ